MVVDLPVCFITLWFCIKVLGHGLEKNKLLQFVLAAILPTSFRSWMGSLFFFFLFSICFFQMILKFNNFYLSTKKKQLSIEVIWQDSFFHRRYHRRKSRRNKKNRTCSKNNRNNRCVLEHEINDNSISNLESGTWNLTAEAWIYMYLGIFLHLNHHQHATTTMMMVCVRRPTNEGEKKKKSENDDPRYVTTRRWGLIYGRQRSK